MLRNPKKGIERLLTAIARSNRLSRFSLKMLAQQGIRRISQNRFNRGFSMDINSVRASLSGTLMTGFDSYERRNGHYQLIVPILHEDGDMVDLYLQDSPFGEGYVRVCDFGLTLMRLSYTYDITTPTRQRIFDSI